MPTSLGAHRPDVVSRKQLHDSLAVDVDVRKVAAVLARAVLDSPPFAAGRSPTSAEWTDLPLLHHVERVVSFVLTHANEKQRLRWFPAIASGQLPTAIAIAEPRIGHELQRTRTSAVRDGENYYLTGTKTSVVGGMSAELILVVGRTFRDARDPRRGLTLLAVEHSWPGVEKTPSSASNRTRPDVAELDFADVQVPAANVIGEAGSAFEHLSRS